MIAEAPSRAEVSRLFEENAVTYDRVNTAISLGLDRRWRDWVARQSVVSPGARVLDAFAGTGLVGLRAAELGARVTLADASAAMLEQARRSAARRRVSARFVTADLTAELPHLDDAPFDAITVVFGVRYVRAPSEVLRRLSALLAPGGRMVVMDFISPERGVVARLAAVYFFHILPKLASALAGRRALYDVLTRTTKGLRGQDDLASIVKDAGLRVTDTSRRGFGLVVGIVAQAD